MNRGLIVGVFVASFGIVHQPQRSVHGRGRADSAYRRLFCVGKGLRRIDIHQNIHKKTLFAMNATVNIDLCLETAMKAGKEAGQVIKEAWDKPRSIEHKGAIDLVTETDKECENLIRGILCGEFPDHAMIGEEETAALGTVPELTDEPTWLVDPVDGTTNFVHKFPFCCVSIALAVRKEVVVAVVYNPVLEEMFAATKGGGAFLNGQRISSSDARDMKSSIFITELGTRRDSSFMEAAFNRIKAMAIETRGMRSCGSCALNLCSVACGRADAYYEIGLGGPWDMAAGALVLQEAGGIVSDPVGSPLNIMSRRVLGTNGHLHKTVTAILAKVGCLEDEPQPLP